MATCYTQLSEAFKPVQTKCDELQHPHALAVRVFVCSVHSGCFFIKLLIDTPGRNATGCFETDMHAIWIWEEIRNYVQFF